MICFPQQGLTFSAIKHQMAFFCLNILMDIVGKKPLFLSLHFEGTQNKSVPYLFPLFLCHLLSITHENKQTTRQLVLIVPTLHTVSTEF